MDRHSTEWTKDAPGPAECLVVQHGNAHVSERTRLLEMVIKLTIRPTQGVKGV